MQSVSAKKKESVNLCVKIFGISEYFVKWKVYKVCIFHGTFLLQQFSVQGFIKEVSYWTDFSHHFRLFLYATEVHTQSKWIFSLTSKVFLQVGHVSVFIVGAIIDLCFEKEWKSTENKTTNTEVEAPFVYGPFISF